MYYCKVIDKKGVLLHEYSQSAILHAPHFRRVVKTHVIAPFQIRPIKLTKRAQIPAGTLPERGLTVKQVQALDDETEEVERVPTYRPKDETAEEKRARKAAIKDERKVSRLLY